MQKKNKTIYCFLILFAFSLSFLYAENKHIVNFSIGLQSGFPLYKRSETSNQNLVLNTENYKRIVIGINTELSLNISEPIILVLGADSICDFVWNNPFYYNSLDYAFYTGVKVHPGLAGLNLGLSYAFGCRTDFFKQEEEADKAIDSTAWGNGFRFCAEYDFFYNDDTMPVYPVLGFAYRFMPRGRYSYDNLLSAYISIKF